MAWPTRAAIVARASTVPRDDPAKAVGPRAGTTEVAVGLREAHVVGTPGSGFGSCGEGYFRLSAFGFPENVEEAVSRIASKLPAR